VLAARLCARGGSIERTRAGVVVAGLTIADGRSVYVKAVGVLRGSPAYARAGVAAIPRHWTQAGKLSTIGFGSEGR